MPDVTHGQCRRAVPMPDVTHGQCQWQCQRLVSLTDNVSASVDVNACCHSWTKSMSVPDVIHGRCQCQRQCLMSLMDNVSVQCQCLMSLMDNVSGNASAWCHSCTMSMAVPVSMSMPDVTHGQCQ